MTDKRIITALAEQEIEDANRKHPPLFASPHEAYAVLKEEVEELHDELVACESLLGDMWHRVKNDWETESALRLTEAHAICAAQEAIQVAAMCRKAINSLKK